MFGVESTIRKAIKAYGYEGNGKYGIGKCHDVEGWIDYLCKGDSEEEDPDIRFKDGFDVNDRHVHWGDHGVLQRVEWCSQPLLFGISAALRII